MALCRLSARAFSLLVSGMVLAACSGQAHQPAAGAAAAAGAGAGGNPSSAAGANTAGQAGSLASAGAASVDLRNPNLPAPLDDSCERFQITEAACMANQCPAWPCAEGTPPLGLGPDWLWCMPPGSPGHCLRSFDCTLANADTAGAALLNCLTLYQPCRVDADCSAQNPFCVIDAHYTSGSCASGSAGARCRADTDCQSGSLCVALDQSGTRGCSDGAEASPCNIDAECRGKRCIHEPPVAIKGLNENPPPTVAGICSTGEPGTPCFTPEGSCPPLQTCLPVVSDADCVGGARCIRVSARKPNPGGALCSSGNVGDPCAQGSDCTSTLCEPAADDSPFWSTCSE